VLLSNATIRSRLKIGAQEKETTQAKSNLRAIAAKVRRVRFKKIALIKGKAHIAPQVQAPGPGERRPSLRLSKLASPLAVKMTPIAAFFSSWGNVVNTGTEKIAQIRSLPPITAKGHKMVMEVPIIQSLSAPLKQGALESPPHIIKKTNRTVYITVRPTAVNIKREIK
jgi:hypothetical protein